MEEIKRLLIDSIRDYRLNTSERKELKALIKSKNLNKRDRDFLRSQIFDIALSNSEKLNKTELLNWIESCNKLTLQTDYRIERNTAYFSPGTSCQSAIISQIKNAKSSIKICVFTISDNLISSEIIAAHKRNISVKVITDNDKSFDMGSDIDQLSKKGIQVKIDRTDSHMHHKFCLIDKSTLITGSYNWTRSAAEKNQENIIVSQDLGIVKSFLKEFERLWDSLIAY
jgi:phosphatidylserine/phosphatidylglycerophosphate/cardiolipin synthase-like enzyme